MTALDMLKTLAACGVLYIQAQTQNIYLVEDSESYAGSAIVQFDDNGNCIKIS